MGDTWRAVEALLTVLVVGSVPLAVACSKPDPDCRYAVNACPEGLRCQPSGDDWVCLPAERADGEVPAASGRHPGPCHMELVESDGSIGRTWEYSYNRHELPSQLEIRDQDGRLVAAWSVAYDASGNATTIRQERGEHPERCTFSYDDAGRRLSRDLFRETDEGMRIHVTRYEWGDDGRLASVEYDENNDGEVDTHLEYSYRADGSIERRNIDAEGRSEVEIFTYGGPETCRFPGAPFLGCEDEPSHRPPGCPTTHIRRSGASPHEEMRIEYVYDEDGNLVEKAEENRFGTVYWRNSWDEDGNLLSEAFVEPGRGGPSDYVIRYDYSCWGGEAD
jgi:YD repeat-containing protein